MISFENITGYSSFQRQDLVAVIAQLMRPISDQVHIKVDMNKDDMDSIILCVATKKSALRLSKDMADLVSFLWFAKYMILKAV